MFQLKRDVKSAIGERHGLDNVAKFQIWTLFNGREKLTSVEVELDDSIFFFLWRVVMRATLDSILEASVNFGRYCKVVVQHTPVHCGAQCLR